jgi:hypothetical protein
MSTRKRKSDSLFSSIIKLTFAFLFVALSTYNLELVPKCSAQVLYGSLTGTVKDASGAIVSGARVTALETRTGISQQTTTDSAGIYRFTTLLPGTYKVTIAASGFSAQETSAIVVSTNEVARVDAQLNVAGASQTVTVTTEPPLLQTDRSDVRTDLNAPEVQSLPAISSEGRSFQAL